MTLRPRGRWASEPLVLTREHWARGDHDELVTNNKGLEESWNVGPVGSGTGTGPHEHLPELLALEDITQPEWTGTWPKGPFLRT